MNKLPNSLFAFAFVALLSFTSCGEDETTINNELIIDGEEIEVDDFNIYFAYQGQGYYGATREEGNSITHVYRNITISDGVLSNTGYDAEMNPANYEGATFLVIVRLSIPVDEEFEGGEFPQVLYHTNLASDVQVSWVQARIIGSTNVYSYTYPGDPVVISGNWDDGDKIDLRLDANDLRNITEDTYGASLKFRFKGTVEQNLYNPQ